MNSAASGLPARVRLVVFDLDGVIYRGSQPVPGAPKLVAWLRGTGTAVRFATNNSTVDRAGYVTRLAGMGIESTADEIVTSTSATVEHLHRHLPDVRRVLGIGAEGMRAELAEAGFEVEMAGDRPPPEPAGTVALGFDAVIIGLDPELDYRRLTTGMAAVAGGARLIATNTDARYPTAAGFLPGAGAVVNALVTSTGVAADVIGKPSPAMFTSVIEAAGVAPDETVVVGDNPEADVAGAHRAGCAAILVLTGVCDAERAAHLEGELAPNAVAADPDAVRALLSARVG